jgi:hypothetical protein
MDLGHTHIICKVSQLLKMLVSTIGCSVFHSVCGEVGDW